MKLDVSDLFDHMYDVAILARARFDISQSTDADASVDAWDAFCVTLSNQLFLPACASRAFAVTHVKMASADVRTRIVTERSPETGMKILYFRYIRPEFFGGACFLASPDNEQYESAFTRPKHKLTMWLGKLPPNELDVTPPEYPSDLDTPIRYYARQRFGFLSRSPQTLYYEFHGEWCLRHVRQDEESFTRFTLGGQWRQIDELVEIRKGLFDKIWAAAEDGPSANLGQY